MRQLPQSFPKTKKITTQGFWPLRECSRLKIGRCEKPSGRFIRRSSRSICRGPPTMPNKIDARLRRVAHTPSIRRSAFQQRQSSIGFGNGTSVSAYLSRRTIWIEPSGIAGLAGQRFHANISRPQARIRIHSRLYQLKYNAKRRTASDANKTERLTVPTVLHRSALNRRQSSTASRWRWTTSSNPKDHFTWKKSRAALTRGFRPPSSAR